MATGAPRPDPKAPPRPRVEVIWGWGLRQRWQTGQEEPLGDRAKGTGEPFSALWMTPGSPQGPHPLAFNQLEKEEKPLGPGEGLEFQG